MSAALIAAVEAAGYRARVPAPSAVDDDPARPYRRRLIGAVAASIPLVVLAWVPGGRSPGWEWLSLALATPVVLYGGWPFHRAAAANARHGVATMDTLISVGTLAAWSWSAVVLLAGLRAPVYFDTAGAVTALVLLGRYLEARAPPGRQHRGRWQGGDDALGRGGAPPPRPGRQTGPPLAGRRRGAGTGGPVGCR